MLGSLARSRLLPKARRPQFPRCLRNAKPASQLVANPLLPPVADGGRALIGCPAAREKMRAKLAAIRGFPWRSADGD